MLPLRSRAANAAVESTSSKDEVGRELAVDDELLGWTTMDASISLAPLVANVVDFAAAVAAAPTVLVAALLRL